MELPADGLARFFFTERFQHQRDCRNTFTPKGPVSPLSHMPALPIQAARTACKTGGFSKHLPLLSRVLSEDDSFPLAKIIEDEPPRSPEDPLRIIYGLPPGVRPKLKKTLRSLCRGSFEDAALHSCVALETELKNIIQGGGKFFALIDKAYHHGLISGEDKSMLHAIRMARNDLAHDTAAVLSDETALKITYIAVRILHKLENAP